MISIDCSGQILKTTRATLSKATYFQAILERWQNKANDTIHVDCDPILFGHFLNVLRFSTYKIPQHLEYNVEQLFDYFGYERYTDYIVIDCRGVLFEINRDVSQNIETLNLSKTNTVCVIYEDPDVFKHVVNILSDKNYVIPDNVIVNVYNLIEKYKIKYQCKDLIIDCQSTIFRIDRKILIESDVTHSLDNIDILRVQENPNIFKHVLEYIRNKNYIVPNCILRNFILCCQKYGIIAYSLKIISGTIDQYSRGKYISLNINHILSIKFFVPVKDLQDFYIHFSTKENRWCIQHYIQTTKCDVNNKIVTVDIDKKYFECLTYIESFYVFQNNEKKSVQEWQYTIEYYE